MQPANPLERSASAAPDNQPDADLACRVVNVGWAIVASRGPYRSHLDRWKALKATGRLFDETNPVFHQWAER